MKVIVMGAGISGLAAASALADADVDVKVVDMGENPGGRLAVRDLSATGTAWDGHVVDVGAAYFTVRDNEFATQVQSWTDEGLVRQWCDTATVVDEAGFSRRQGPMRYASPRGLRSLARAMVADLAARAHVTVDFSTVVAAVQAHAASVDVVLRDCDEQQIRQSVDAVILACPDPQALRVLHAQDFVELRATLAEVSWEPVICHTMVFHERFWPDDDLWFVNDSSVLATVADDGRRRGDGAAVLVAHSTAAHAEPHLGNPEAAVCAIEAEVARVLRTWAEPAHRITKRWGLARPQRAREELCGWDRQTKVAVCGDGWAGPSRIEAAWLSGRAAARQVLATLGH